MQTATDTAPEEATVNKEPWLAAILSLLLPGAGQLYCRLWQAGIVLILLWVLLSTLLVGSLIVWQVPTAVFAIALLCSAIVHIGAPWSAHRAAKRRNTADFESQRREGKDPWLAVFLTLIVPGLGHLYLRRWIVGAVGIVLVVALPARGSTYGQIAFIALRALFAFHAYFVHRTNGFNRRKALVVLTAVAVGAPALFHVLASCVLKPLVVEVYMITAQSMAPTIRKGMRVTANKLAYRWHEPAVGDIIVLTDPMDSGPTSGVPIMKRIVAVGGQMVHVRGGLVWIDGQYREPTHEQNRLVSDRYLSRIEAKYFIYGVAEPYRVPEGCYFVLGDNRDNSLDSRCYGAVPKEAIIGKVARVLWPLNRPPLYGPESP